MGYNQSQRIKTLKDRRAQGMDVKSLAEDMEAKRKREGLSIRRAGFQAGVPFSTFAHVARQAGRIPDMDTLEKICAWLKAPVSRYLKNLPPEKDALVVTDGRPIPEIVEGLLMGDENLTPEAARVIGIVFREGYQFFVEGRDVLRNAMQPARASKASVRPAKRRRA